MLILDVPRTWPKKITEDLKHHSVVALCRANGFMDDIHRRREIVDILADAEGHARQVGLAVYHCTKQLRDRPFAATGLRVLDFATHHAECLEVLREHASEDHLFAHIESVLADWKKDHTGKREGMLWCCLTRRLALHPGTESFFRYFGGEAVYMPFLRDERVAPVLERIGEPVVVEAHVNANDLTVFRQQAFGRTLVSHFANSVNPEFCIEELEGYVSSDIPPSRIVAVYPLTDFRMLVNEPTK